MQLHSLVRFTRSGKEADRSAACRNDCSGPYSKEGRRSESRSEKARWQKGRQSRQRKRGRDKTWAANPHYQIIRRPDHHGKRFGREGIALHCGFLKFPPKQPRRKSRKPCNRFFQVKVADVRTANFPGKMRRRGHNEGYRRDWKKAYVKLAEGEKMIEYADNLYNSGHERKNAEQ